MGLINFLYTMGRIAKTRSRAKAIAADDVAKVNQLGRVKSDFVLLYTSIFHRWSMSHCC